MKRGFFYILIAAGFLVFSGSRVMAASFDAAVLQALDKVTARVTTLDAPIGRIVRFGTLEIIVRHCDKRPPEETPESAAFIDIWDAQPGEPASGVFRGWMFASSPALNPMEHPVYDVWMLDCKGRTAVPPPGQAVPGPAR